MSNILKGLSAKLNRLSPKVRKSEAIQKRFQKSCAEQYENYLKKGNMDFVFKGGDEVIICNVAGNYGPIVSKIMPWREMSDSTEKYLLKSCEGIVEDEEKNPTYINFKKYEYSNGDEWYVGFVKEDDHFEKIDSSNISNKHRYLAMKIDKVVDETVLEKLRESIKENSASGLLDIFFQLKEIYDRKEDVQL